MTYKINVGLYLGFLMVLGVLAFPALTNATLYSNLVIGSTGGEVRELQVYLAQDASIYPEGLVTGYYGVLTASAVTRFQARYGISQTGTVGPITRAKINSLIGAPIGPVGPVNAGIGGDVNSAVITSMSLNREGTRLTFGWTTNENATSKVYYSRVFPFVYMSAPAATTGGVSTVHRVVVENLDPHAIYYYGLESVDAGGNITWTLPLTTSTL